MANDRTEKATPKRRDEARNRGQVPRSPEVNAAVGLMAAFGVLSVAGGWALGAFEAIMAGGLSEAGQADGLTPSEAMGRLLGAGWDGMRLTAPFMAVGALAGLVASVAQVKPKITPQALKPRFQVLNPITGVKRMVSRRSLVTLVKDLLKLALIGGVAWVVVEGAIPDLMALTGAGPGTVLSVVGGLVMRLGFAVGGVYLVIAVADWIFQRHEHERDLRMTKDEVKREAKEADVNPQVRGQIRARQREMAMRRMMAAVPGADVVITNPTHFAVALRYARSMAAPEVVAKGADHVAHRIIAAAREAGIAVVQDPPLARSLHAAVEVGQSVPPESFAAVAEILAFVYRAAGREPAAA